MSEPIVRSPHDLARLHAALDDLRAAKEVHGFGCIAWAHAQQAAWTARSDVLAEFIRTFEGKSIEEEPLVSGHDPLDDDPGGL